MDGFSRRKCRSAIPECGGVDLTIGDPIDLKHVLDIIDPDYSSVQGIHFAVTGSGHHK